MKTEIKFLRQLEADIADAASREMARRERASLQGAIRRNTGRVWVKVAGIAAAFLVVAGAIGFVAGGEDFQAFLSPSGQDGGPVEDARRVVGGDVGSDDQGVAPGNEAMPSPTSVPGSDYSVGGDSEEGLGDGSAGVDRQRRQQDLSKIVRNGRIGIVVPDGGFGDATGEITLIAERHGGFVLSSSTNDERSGTFVLRIPASRFDRAIVDIRELADRVRFQEIQGDDVTAEYIDFQARLRILQARRALLFDLFQDADTTDEILRLSGQLEDVQFRIEQIQGRLRFLNDQVAESTLRVSIQERNAPVVTPEAEVDNPDLGSSLDLAVQGFLRIVGAVIVGIGYLIPITAIAGLVWMAVWFVRRRAAA
jgi:hypothetical protein